MADFSLLRTPDYFGGAINALHAGQQDKLQRDRRNALSTYGTDPSGARNALMGLGDVETAGQLQGMEFAQNREGREARQADNSNDDAQLKRVATVNGFLLNATRALGSVPAEQRDQYFAQAIVPELQRLNIAPEMIQRLASGKKDDQSLASYAQLLGQEAKEIKYQFMGLGDGGVARGNPDTGELKVMREPKPSPFAMDPEKTYVDLGGGASPGEVDFDAIDQTVLKAFPTSRVTSAARTPEQNAEAHGVANSFHLDDQARDYHTPQGMTSAQFASQLRQTVPAGIQVIDEGNHVHIEPEGARGGSRVLQKAQPKATANSAPSGYRFKADGGLEFIPGGPADPSVSSSTKGLKPIPAAALTGMTMNKQALAKIDNAIKLIEANPNALGAGNYVNGSIRDRMSGNGDNNGVPARAALAAVGSQKLHDLSGAAVSESEWARLKPYIPLTTDRADVAVQKLKNLRQEYQIVLDQSADMYNAEAGYRSPNEPGPKATTGAPAVGDIVKGYRFKGGDPADQASWVKQ